MTPLCAGMLDPLLGCIITGTPRPGGAHQAQSASVRSADENRRVTRDDGRCPSLVAASPGVPPLPSPVSRPPAGALVSSGSHRPEARPAVTMLAGSPTSLPEPKCTSLEILVRVSPARTLALGRRGARAAPDGSAVALGRCPGVSGGATGPMGAWRSRARRRAARPAGTPAHPRQRSPSNAATSRRTRPRAGRRPWCSAGCCW